MTHQPSTCPQCAMSLTDQQEGQRFCPGCRFPLVRIAGKYELLERLAEGGFGVVYLARHTALHQDSRRVIKVFKPEIFGLDDGGMHERFLREVRVTAALSEENQHIVRIYDDFGLEPGLGHYYVMEWLRGETLDALMRGQTSLTHAYIFEVTFQLCRAMRAAHSKGIIHRDLKPDNIFLVQREDLDPFIKVIDFGIAKTLKGTSQQHMTQGAIGTPYYMSPEQCLGQAVDARTDIYAMGILLYEMLTGSPPFVAENAEQLLSVIHSHIAVPPPSMREVRPALQVDEGLERVVLQALAKESTERYPSVEAFWNALLPYAPEGHSLTRMDEPPLDEAFLLALEASQTIPVESMRGVPTDPEEALKWLQEPTPGSALGNPSGDLLSASMPSPLLDESLARVGTSVGASKSDSAGANASKSASAGANASKRANANTSAFWHRLPIWMWFTLLALLCVGVLFGVWLPIRATDSRLVTKQLSRRIGQDMSWRAAATRSQPPMQSPTRYTHSNRPDSEPNKPAADLATRRQALATKRRSQTLPKRHLSRRSAPRRTRPRPHRRALLLPQQRQQAEAQLQRAQKAFAKTSNAATAHRLLRAHLRVVRLYERGRKDPQVLRWHYLSLMRAAKQSIYLLSDKHSTPIRRQVARASYQLAMFAFHHFRRASIFASNQRELRDTIRTKHQRYRQTIKQLHRTIRTNDPTWRFCAQVRVAEATMLMADALDQPERLQQCTDCRPGPAFFYRHLLRRFIRPLRRLSQRQLKQAQQVSAADPTQHSCVRLLHRLQAKSGAPYQK